MKTLDEALADIARRSFYEDARVVPIVNVDTGEPVGYLVEDTTTHATDDWEWTYEDGVRDRDSVSETSRLHDAYETYKYEEHVRYNMPDAVDALERGIAVDFAYAVVRDANAVYDDESGEYVDEDGEPTDEYAGWIAVAIWDEED